MQPGPSDGTATVKLVDSARPTWASPRPACSRSRSSNGMKLKSVFHMGALDTFGFAFRKGEGANDLKTLEGKTILLGSAGWQSIVDPMLAVQGVDITQGQICRGRLADLGHGAASRARATRRCRWEGLRAEWIGQGLDFDYWLGVQTFAAVRPTPSSSAPPTSRTRTRRPSSRSICAAGRWASSSATRTRAPRSKRVRAVPDACLEHRAGARHHFDPAAGQRLPRRHGQAPGLGLARHGEPGRPSSTRSTS